MRLQAVPNQDNRVNWGAIFCGTFATLGAGIFMMLLGNAIGLSAVNILDVTTSNGLQITSWIYTLAAMLLSFFVGGTVCSRIAGIESSRSASLHAMISWAVAGTIITAIGIQQSILFRLLVLDEGPNAANWLLCGIAGFGAVAAVLGGRAGARSRAQREIPTVVEEEKEEEPTSRAA